MLQVHNPYQSHPFNPVDNNRQGLRKAGGGLTGIKEQLQTQQQTLFQLMNLGSGGDDDSEGDEEFTKN